MTDKTKGEITMPNDKFVTKKGDFTIFRDGKVIYPPELKGKTRKEIEKKRKKRKEKIVG